MHQVAILYLLAMYQTGGAMRFSPALRWATSLRRCARHNSTGQLCTSRWTLNITLFPCRKSVVGLTDTYRSFRANTRKLGYIAEVRKRMFSLIEARRTSSNAIFVHLLYKSCTSWAIIAHAVANILLAFWWRWRFTRSAGAQGHFPMWR